MEARMPSRPRADRRREVVGEGRLPGGRAALDGNPGRVGDPQRGHGVRERVDDLTPRIANQQGTPTIAKPLIPSVPPPPARPLIVVSVLGPPRSGLRW